MPISCFRSLLAFIFIPMMQTELDKFKNMIWNSHRIREQKETELPAGVPNHIYGFPENYQLEDCGVYCFFTFLVFSYHCIQPEFITVSESLDMCHHYMLSKNTQSCTSHLED